MSAEKVRQEKILVEDHLQTKLRDELTKSAQAGENEIIVQGVVTPLFALHTPSNEQNLVYPLDR